jgi:eukaryotic-like serine/threonine-protein kinase
VTPEQFARVELLFEGACEQPPACRADWLRQQCADDPEVVGKVERMLLRDSAAASLLDAPALGAGFHVGRADELDQRLREELDAGGRFRIVSLLGEGGFGSVYRAEQLAPVRRDVALKVIKLGMDTRRILARFEAERQTLAVMNHSAISRLLDAGVTRSGRPYFAMELVEGPPITAYCDSSRLGMSERLELFIRVCEAIRYAHQRGVLHRDIKPSNILVAQRDGESCPVVIDFGIARALDAESGAATLMTEHGQMVGTPEYMSPEQAEGSRDIDTRTDIYSLGVLLYRLLTGTTPFDRSSAAGTSVPDLQRMIREQEPLRPSTRVRRSRGAEGAGGVGGAGTAVLLPGTDAGALSRLLQRDLDWIVMKALEKDRSLRYETVDAFVADIRRFLRNEPVLARPQSAAYRFGKFARRHRAPLAAAAAMVALLMTGIVGTSVGLVRSRAAQATAHEQRERAEAISAFIASAMLSLDPYSGGKQDMRISEAMHRAVGQLESGAFKSQPGLEAELKLMIARILGDNAKPAEALPLVEQAIEALAKIHPEESRELAGAYHQLAITLIWLGRHQDAEPHARRALAIRRQLHPGDSAEAAESLHGLGVILHSFGQFEQARACYEEGLAMSGRLSPGDSVYTVRGLANLASVLQHEGRLADAEAHMRLALAMSRRLYPDEHPSVARSMFNLAMILLGQGQTVEADELTEGSLAMYRTLFPGDHPDVATGLRGRALALRAAGRPGEAEPLLRDSLDMQRRLTSGDHPDIALVLSDLADVMVLLQRPEEAGRLVREALEMSTRLYAGDHPSRVLYGINLAVCEIRLGRAREALALAERALAMAARVYPEGHPMRIQCETILRQIRERAGARSGEAPSRL